MHRIELLAVKAAELLGGLQGLVQAAQLVRETGGDRLSASVDAPLRKRRDAFDGYVAAVGDPPQEKVVDFVDRLAQGLTIGLGGAPAGIQEVGALALRDRVKADPVFAFERLERRLKAD